MLVMEPFPMLEQLYGMLCHLALEIEGTFHFVGSVLCIKRFSLGTPVSPLL